MLKRNLFLLLFTAGALFMAGCQSSQDAEDTDANTVDSGGGVTAPPPASQNQGVNTPTPSVTAPPPPAPDARQPGVQYGPEPAELATSRNDEAILNDWRSILREFHDIRCKEMKGQVTSEDKVRITELTRQMAVARTKLRGSEQIDFMSEMNKTMDMKNCP